MTPVILLAAGLSQTAGPLVRQVEEQQLFVVLTGQRFVAVEGVVESWAKRPRDVRARLATRLVPSMHTTALVGLPNPADAVIFYRLKTGEMKFRNHGLLVRQDLYLSGGRAAWAISKLIGADDLPNLDGGLSAGTWNRRALAIEAKVAAFAQLPAKPVPHSLPVTNTHTPHPLPALQGVLAAAPLLTRAPGPWSVPKIILLAEARLVNEFLTSGDWPRIRELTKEWDGLPADVRTRLTERLVPHLRQTGHVQLKATDGLEIPYRVKSGDLKAAPGGFVTEHDLFLVGGRASYAIYYLTGGGGTVPLHGGLTVDEWNKRADAVAGYAKRFIEGNTPMPKK